jgi:hypothetical protein
MITEAHALRLLQKRHCRDIDMCDALHRIPEGKK